MKIPKYVQAMICRRYLLACKLKEASLDLDDWIARHGGDLEDESIIGCTTSGCMTIEEPGEAREAIENYILTKM